MKIGYARVSTDDQNLDLQKDALNAAGCERLFFDKASGAKVDRPGLTEAIQFARAGDVLIVWRLDRLGRSLSELVTLINSLEKAGISFASLTEHIDTTSATGELIFHIFGSMAQFERRLIIERTNAGLAAARARGIKGGRPGVTEEKIAAIRSLAKSSQSPAEACKVLNISRSTFYKYAR